MGWDFLSAFARSFCYCFFRLFNPIKNNGIISRILKARMTDKEHNEKRSVVACAFGY